MADLREFLPHCEHCKAVGEPDDHRHKAWCPMLGYVPNRLEEAARAVVDWYDKDGSVGAADEVIAQLRAALAVKG